MNMRDLQEKQKQNKPGLYVGARLSKDSTNVVATFMKENDIPNKLASSKLHCTVIYSTAHVDGFQPQGNINPPWVADVVGFEVWESPANDVKEQATKCCIMKIKCPKMVNRHEEIMDSTVATHGYPEFKTHITLSYNIPEDLDVSELHWDGGQLTLDHEYMEELNTNWNDN